MNRYFIPGEGRRGYPRRAYARIDEIEPINLEAADFVSISLDAVDADWTGFQARHLLSLIESENGAKRLAAYWKYLFLEGPPRKSNFSDGPFDDLPLYQIEITLPRGSDLLGTLIYEDGWLEICLAENGGVAVDVFGGLFSEPAVARLVSISRSTATNALNAVFDMQSWPDASELELRRALNIKCEITQLHMLDVGQGGAVAIICECGRPIYYFDVGCGVYRNTKTNPNPIQFCVCDDPPVILSHWDSDHWAGANLDTDLLKRVWIAPRQTVGAKHIAFANRILSAGGKILLVPQAFSGTFQAGQQKLKLQQCKGAPTDRNGSGLVLVVEDQNTDRGWLLTGDAPYNLIPGPLPSDLAAVVVPHHGADMGPGSKPPLCSQHAYSRLLYSFGPGNAHGRTSVRHPTAAAVSAHSASGWGHGAWLPPPPGRGLAGHPVLATASHPHSHHGGIAVGWTSAPPTAAHLASCGKAMQVTQT
ncbi:metallo-hydrolase/oxidoreductase [Ralstonia pseudosolanacearum]|uniref:Metallo-hydrolase/oxidoreductase n=1 Tax=Ralstonia solanacearum TaxID=305 RepID=A0AA92EGG3_RALSL|nr:metallo-hydrolase/oxidoreductase [Ralstonia pseudosolanacearum]QCX51607.1 metallo-hydrolase/oxidoreductase [Ralstonia pseudosolanacearum]